MTIHTDFHSHVSRSSALQMVQVAQEKGIRVLGLSEHDFQMQEARPTMEHMPLEGPLLTFAAYIESVRAAGQQAHFDVRLGMEVDFIPGKNEDIQASIQGHDWDFLIGSVHEIDGLLLESKWNISRETGQALWLRYFGLLGEVVSSGYFSLVSHPVRMRVGNPHLPPNFDEELERLATEATRCDVALELNGYDVLTYPSLVRKLAKACALQRTPVSIGSDAHRPGEVAQAHDPTKEIMREAGLSRIRTWKQRVPEEYSIYQGLF
jgi:histidinol-phosphatase (PHP family)